MRNDLFIDNNIAKSFSTPLDPEYKKLIEWLRKRNENTPEKDAHLVISSKLVAEYHRSNLNNSAATNILTLVNILTKQGRINKITNTQIKDFQQKHFTKAVEKKLKCNHEDREHIPVVLLSDRKFALAIDKNFCADLQAFPRHTVTVNSRPENLPYEEDWSKQ
jgi:hypothetical protein